MKTVSVQATKSYNVHIGEGLLNHLGEYAAAVHKICKVAVISDTNVWPHYGQTAKNALEKSGFNVINYIFPAGEASKNGTVYLDILNFLAEAQLSRSDLLIALGGGVVGDMTGFVAATYLRGINFIQIPTTLLAMVDSSVGGKTAIDLPAGKNLAGAFYQPALVLCDLKTLNTLPMDVLRDGCAEVIKYGILYDNDLFSHLSEKAMNFDRESVIARCVELKRNVVAEDEFDHGNRQKLNLGHTIGHGIEACSQYNISHGSAVAAGMAIVARAAMLHNYCDAHCTNQILHILNAFGLPTNTIYDAEALYKCALSDKKRAGGIVNLIVPKNIGDCYILPTPTDAIKEFIATGL